jgi:hypothetical protein
MSNWIEHVKDFSKKNHVSYKEAMSSAKCKNEYTKAKINGGYLPSNVKSPKLL